jgi:hypothetical protein
MKLYVSSLSAHKESEVLISSAARILIAEDKTSAYAVAMQFCREKFPFSQGYAEHKAAVNELCGEGAPLAFASSNGDVYAIKLERRQE